MKKTPASVAKYGKMKADGHTSVKSVQDVEWTKDTSRKGDIKQKCSECGKAISGTGSLDVDIKSNSRPKMADQKLSEQAARSGYAKNNKGK